MKSYKLRKKYTMIFFLLAAMSFIIFLCLMIKLENKKQEIKIEREDSWFSDFYIKENKVYIQCYITIRNDSNEDQYIKLLAHMEDDAKNKLIKHSIVTGYDEKGSDKFFVPADSEINYIEVFFIDDYAGEEQKQDRNLPEIELVVQ